MLDQLYAHFRDVPHEYSVRPFWFWNGPLTPAEVQRQIEAMVSQGVYGAHVHNRSGLRPRYLSEEWWELVKAGLEKARELDFAFCVVDEYNWPSGEARDYTQAGVPSRVLAANPEFRMRSLVPEMRAMSGGETASIDGLGEHDRAAVGRRLSSGELDADTLRDVTAEVRASGRWQAPDGGWVLYAFRLQPTVGVDGGQVDLMNRDAVRTFLNAIYEEYGRRVGHEFGRAFRATYIDHEGDYGWRLAWTPRLFETFKALKGYDLAPMLPLLLDEGGKRTPTVRCDYFDVVSTLYAESFFQQITDWCRAHNLDVSGHVWEENLLAQVAFQGDHFRIQRALGTPGIDSLFEWGRYPRHFKEASSVAHFRRSAFTVENQGVQGIDDFLSLERIKRTTNMLGVWGTTLFIPHAVNGNPDRIDFPEDWFERQPWWRYFHHYANYAARISYMNSGGRHVCDILLYYPIESVWAHGNVCFLPEKWNAGFEGIDTARGQILRWHNEADEINQVYGDIVDTLPAHLWDLDIADAHYLQEARIDGGRLHLADESFRVLILPPMTTMRLSSARRAREFCEAGGTVIAVGRLPFDSMENGREDPELRREWGLIFGEAITRRAQEGRLQHGVMQSDNGRAVWAAGVDPLLDALERVLERDVRVMRGDANHLFALHRIKDGVHVYWFVNDRDAAREVVVEVPVSGKPELWDADGGERRGVHYTTRGTCTELHLSFAPWQAFYIVFAPDGAAQPVSVVETNLAQYEVRDGVSVHGSLLATNSSAYAVVEAEGRRLEGRVEITPLQPFVLSGVWQCTPQQATAPVCYARMRTAPTGQGEALGWHLPEYNDAFWANEWLSKERFAITDWWVLGKFDYGFGRGFNEVMLPEREIDLDAAYTGRGGKTIRWQRYRSPSRIVDFDTAFGTDKERTQAVRSVTAFALSYVYSPDDRRVELRCVADCNAKVWLNDELLLGERDDHQGYLEMRDAFGMRAPAHLRKGWNRILLKVSQGIRFAGHFAFVVRLCDADGMLIPDLVFSAAQEMPDSPDEATEYWYRLPVPPGATAVRVPLGAALWGDGAQLETVNDGLVSLPASAKLLAIRLDRHLPDFLQFQTGAFDTPLQSWSHTGLSYYTGEFEYVKPFDLPAEYLHYRLMLDLGAVGTTAEVWLNGVRIGERVWQPFSLDITPAARAGANELRVVVGNTAAHQRAGGDTELQLWGVLVRGPGLLDKIEENGLLGPVKIVPWADVEVRCE